MHPSISNKKPNPKIQQLEEANQQLEEAYKRALADYQNLERRMTKDQERIRQLATATLIIQLLSILDQFETAALHLNDQGLDLVLSQLKKLLSDQGVTELNVSNAPFDPHQMECVDMVAGDPGQVIRVVQKGYTLNDHLLRPAKVEVGQPASSSAQTSNNQGGSHE
jgi:molecular chaperone GrpE